LKQTKVITLPKRDKDLKFPQNLHPLSYLSMMGKLFEKYILKIVQRQVGKIKELATWKSV
jgi:hypothetical protein